MSSDNKWKSKLLASGVPLEFEATKILVSQDLHVSSDYTYARNDAGVVKDFSVDIEATGYTPFEDENELTTSISLLVECKHRAPNIKWFFLPDPNRPDYSPITLGQTIRVVDQFSPYMIDVNSTVSFDESVLHCYKGVEVNLGTGDVFDKEIKHGISQLQYALPRLFSQSVWQNGGSGPDSIPFIFCPILLTNAELLVAKENMTIQDIQDCSDIMDLSQSVPYFMLYQDYGPDFEKHCARECASLVNLNALDFVEELQAMIQGSNRAKYTMNYPANIGASLARAERYQLSRFFTQFIVCNFISFGGLIHTIKEVITQAAKTRISL